MSKKHPSLLEQLLQYKEKNGATDSAIYTAIGLGYETFRKFKNGESPSVSTEQKIRAFLDNPTLEVKKTTKKKASAKAQVVTDGIPIIAIELVRSADPDTLKEVLRYAEIFGKTHLTEDELRKALGNEELAED